MEYVNLGRTGLKVSPVCMGTMTYGSKKWREWVLEEAESKPFFRRAFELGINFFDTADMYSVGASEEVTGRALKEFGPGRDRIVIATKVYNPMGDDPNQRGLSRKHIRHAIEDSLRRLGTDYVDLYQIHRFDPQTPIEETMGALHDLVREGKVLYLGASSMFAWQFAKMNQVAKHNGWTPFVMMQNHYNLLYREEEREMVPLCLDQNVGLIPWSPLARGLLARGAGASTVRGKTDNYAINLYGGKLSESDNKVIEAVQAVASARGVPQAQVALAWLSSKPGIVAPIIGASKIHHLEDAVAALSIKLTKEEAASLEAAYIPHPVAGHQ
ncbi:MAG TPA: aldo/keto reductase [Opitutaceae bacterium]|nr:aldo/keto reductase [Opitutaceae bacterium]